MVAPSFPSEISMKTAALIATLATMAPLAAYGEASEPRWKSAMMSGSSRLAAFSLLQERPAGAQRFILSFMKRDGLLHKDGEGAQRVGRHFSIEPLVQHDNNINGGIPVDSIRLAGIDFIINEDDRAKEGFLLGAQASAGIDHSIAKGQVLSFGLTAAYQYSFEHDLGKSFLGGNACLKSHVDNWSWIDSCAGVRLLDNGSTVEEGFLSIAGTKVFASDYADHAFEMKVEQIFREDYDKLSVGGTLTSAVPGIGAVATGLRFGEQVEGENTTLVDGSVALTRPILDRMTTLRLSHRYSAGGEFFGEDREDRTTKISATTDVSKRISLSVGYEVTDSSADLYDDDNVSVGIDFKGWTF